MTSNNQEKTLDRVSDNTQETETSKANRHSFEDPRSPVDRAIKRKWWSETYEKQITKPEGWLGSPSDAKPKMQVKSKDLIKAMSAMSISPIFDGSNSSSHSDSPWAAYLVDKGEDSDYLDNCEHDDDAYRLHGNDNERNL